jgi:CubicO group peptidase (beta-lactamase class C family)
MKKLFTAILALLFSTGAQSQSLSDTVQLEAFMDGLMKTHLRDKHIAGGTVSVVKDGKVMLAKGYGFSDVTKQIPVSPDATLFRIGSISKMFTWISVMQLVSQGKLKLDEDVNHYLKDIQIPTTYEKPITLTDIMTHTPGFEDLVIGLFSKDSASVKPLHDIFLKEMPARIRPAGSYASYSNHATGMAAYIVEQVSGMSFNEYVEKNILTPLHMEHTSFRQPLPQDLKPLLSKGYRYSGGEFLEQPFEFVPLYPVGAAASSATDMVKFMEAILYNGRWNGREILDSATLALMESPAHRHHPHVNPMRHGFMDLSQNGVEIIGHGGDTFWFHSIMALYPASHTGLFVSFNTDKGGGTSMEVFDEFTKKYFPETTPLATPMKADKKFLEQFAGAYRVNRYPHNDITTISSIFNDTNITIADSSRLRVTSGETVRYYVPIDSVTFREEHSSKIMAFEKDPKAGIVHMFIGNMPIIAFDKVSGLKNSGIHIMILIASIIVTLLVLLYWPFVQWVRRGYQSMHDTLPLPLPARRVAYLNYLFLGIFYLGVPIVLSDPESIVYGATTSLKVLLILPMISIVFTFWMTVFSLRLSTDDRFRIWGRIFYALITIMSILALWQLYYWNFVGMNY